MTEVKVLVIGSVTDIAEETANMEETTPITDKSLEPFSEDAETIDETKKATTSKRKRKLFIVIGLLILSCCIVGFYLLSDTVDLHNSKIVQFILETNENLSMDLNEWSQLTPEPVSWKSLERKSKEIHSTVVHYLININNYTASPGKEYDIQQEYKSYLLDIAQQMYYSEKVCSAHEKKQYDDESFYLDEVLVFIRRAYDHLNTVRTYLEKEHIYLNQE